jgi:hypothetical protein
MTDDEFRDKLHELWKEYDPEKKHDFLFTIITFNDKNQPDDIFILGFGCPVCIVNELNEQVEDGTLVHHSEKSSHKVH